MNAIINLRNNYYFSIEKDTSVMSEDIIDIRNIKYSKIVKKGILL